MVHWRQAQSLTCPLQQDAMTSILHYVITSRSRSAFLLRQKYIYIYIYHSDVKRSYSGIAVICRSNMALLLPSSAPRWIHMELQLRRFLWSYYKSGKETKVEDAQRVRGCRWVRDQFSKPLCPPVKKKRGKNRTYFPDSSITTRKTLFLSSVVSMRHHGTRKKN